MHDLSRTAKALEAWDELAKEKGQCEQKYRDLARKCAYAYWEDTRDINDKETILGLFNAAPPPFIRAMVALWKFPEEVGRLKELTKKLVEYSGLTHYWYEITVEWAQNTGALTKEEGEEFARLIKAVGLNIGRNRWV